MRLTFKAKEPYEFVEDNSILNERIRVNYHQNISNDVYYVLGTLLNKLGQLEDIEEKLGFTLNELVEMLINGVWEVGGVDSKTMKPEPSCLLFYYVYGIDFKNKCLKVMRAVGYNERSIERSNEFVFSSLHLCKYKKKCLGGWALTKKELEK